MILFDFLLFVNFDFTISHYDFIGEALKRSNLLTERRLWKSRVGRFIEAFVCEGFDVRSYKLLSGPVAWLSRINWQSWNTFSISVKTLHSSYLCICRSGFNRAVVSAFIQSFCFLVWLVFMDLDFDLVENFTVIFFWEFFTWENFLAFFFDYDLEDFVFRQP